MPSSSNQARRSRLILAVLLALALLHGPAGTAQARPSCVASSSVSSAADSGAGSLRQALADTCAGGTVTFAADYTISLASQLALTQSVTIDGSGRSIALDGSGASNTGVDGGIVTVDAAATVTLRSLTLTKGTARSGGAIYNNGTLTVESSTISSSSAAAVSNDGGAIYNNGTLTISGSTLSGNSAQRNGGGIYNSSGKTLTVTNSTFAGNTGVGGALYNDNGTPTISGSTFVGNTVTTGSGGAIFHAGGTLLITNSTFSANQSTSQFGGAIYNAATLQLRNSTLSGNSAPSTGGLRNHSTGNLSMRNTIIANSSGGDCLNLGGTVSGNTKNLVEDNSCSPALSGDPTLSVLGSYGGSTQTFALLPGSKAINAGDSTYCSASPVGSLDQRGVTRPASCDIGAFESQGFTMAKTAGDNQAALAGEDFGMALGVQLTASAAGEPVGPGGSVTFTAPGSGASLSSATQTASTDGGGAASLSVTANSTAGSYSVTASASGSSSASFSLTNTSCASSRVVTSASDSGAGSLRQAIADACSGATISFADDYDIYPSGQLLLARSVTIDGSGHNITIDGSNGGNTQVDGGLFFVGSGTTVTLRGLALDNGHARSGGGIYNLGTLTVDESTLLNNYASVTGYNGGGIYNNGSLAIIDSTFQGNRTENLGGGIYNVVGKTVTIAGSTFTGQYGRYGGGAIYNDGGNVTIGDASLNGNSAALGTGGAIFNLGIVTVEGSTLSGNTAGAGGGIYNDGTLSIAGSTLSNNVSSASGGALQHVGGTLTLSSSTFSGNQAEDNGGAIDSAATLTIVNSTLSGNGTASVSGESLRNQITGTLTMRNTIIAGSTTGQDCVSDGSIASNANNLVEDGSCGAALSGDPRVGPLGDYGGDTETFALLPGSKAIDAADSATCAGSPVGGLDQRGVARPTACDIGAFESRGFTIAVTGGNNQSTTPGDDFGYALAVRLTPNVAGEPAGPGGVVTFTAPASGASLSILSQTAETDTGGNASVAAGANAVEGSYTVTATTRGVASPASFSLSNAGCSPSRVVTSADDSGTGSLREAISVICAGGTISFAADYTIALASHLELLKSPIIDAGEHSITLDGGAVAANSVDGGIMWIDALATVTLRGLTLTHGKGQSGGAIYNWGKLTVEDSTISANVTSGSYKPGGGIYNNGTLTVTNSLFSENDMPMGSGPAIFNGGGRSATISGSTFSGNSALDGSGGALYNLGAMSIAGSAFSSNSALGSGGAISHWGGTLMIEGSSFIGNISTEDNGGAIFSRYPLAIDNSTFSGNYSPRWGGAIHSQGQLTLRNSTLSGNSSDRPGGGLNNFFGTLTMVNTIIANSTAGGDCDSGFGTISSNVNNLVEDGGCSATLSGDPLLAPLDDYGVAATSAATQTFALLAGSPALDAGASAGCLAKDQRGVARPQQFGCDIGAFESRGFELTVLSGNSQRTGTGSAFASPLVVRLESLESGVTVGASVLVTFTAPISGSSLSTAIISGTTDASGVVTATVSANAVEGSYVVTATALASAPVTFTLQQDSPKALSIQRTGTGTGSVSSSPGGIDCGVTCSALFDHAAVVTLTATPADGSMFSGWEGACASASGPTCQLTMSAAHSVVARFSTNRVLLPLIQSSSA